MFINIAYLSLLNYGYIQCQSSVDRNVVLRVFNENKKNEMQEWVTYIDDNPNRINIIITGNRKQVRPFILEFKGLDASGESIYIVRLSKRKNMVFDLDRERDKVIGFPFHGNDNQKFVFMLKNVSDKLEVFRIKVYDRCLVATENSEIIVGLRVKNFFKDYFKSLCNPSDLSSTQTNEFEIIDYDLFEGNAKRGRGGDTTENENKKTGVNPIKEKYNEFSSIGNENRVQEDPYTRYPYNPEEIDDSNSKGHHRGLCKYKLECDCLCDDREFQNNLSIVTSIKPLLDIG